MLTFSFKTPLLIGTCLSLPLMGLSNGEEVEKSLPNYEITKTGPDQNLKKNESAFQFSFVLYSSTGKTTPIRNATFQMAYNNKVRVIKTDAKEQYHFKTIPGKYVFQFFYDEGHREVYTDSITIGSGIKTEITVYFRYEKYPVIAEKPVIYLYPEKTTEVDVQLAVKGNMLFTYPIYNEASTDGNDSVGQGWKVTAEPNGTLKQGDKTYNYLFWEAEIPALNRAYVMCEAVTVDQANLLAYLERTLTAIGLNNKESQDFITYWYPRMQQYKNTSVKFLLNENVDAYAHLDITPKPDRVLRLFMLWSPVVTGCPAKIPLAKYPVFKRAGFTVVEWGGMQVTPVEN